MYWGDIESVFNEGASPEQVDKLIVHWPSGTVRELGPLPVNAHVRVTEGKDDFEVVLRAKQVTEGQVGQRSETPGTSG